MVAEGEVKNGGERDRGKGCAREESGVVGMGDGGGLGAERG